MRISQLSNNFPSKLTNSAQSITKQKESVNFSAETKKLTDMKLVDGTTKQKDLKLYVTPDLLKRNPLQQASNSQFAQANQTPGSVLNLLT